MHLFNFAALAGLFVAVVYAEIDSSCGSVATVSVTVTAIPVTKTVSIQLEISPSITKKYDVPPKLQAALDTSKDITATSTDYITLIHVVTAIPKMSTPAVVENGPYYFTADDGTTVWLGGKTPPAGVPLSISTAIVTVKPIPPTLRVSSGGSPESTTYSTVFLTVTSKVYETETVTKTVPVVITSVVTTSSFVSVSSSNTGPLASPVPFIANAPSAAKASLVATTPSKSFNGLGLSGWNATSKTLLKEKVVVNANESAKLVRQQTGVKDSLATRPGAATLLATPSYSSNATNKIGVRQLGSIVVATIEGVVVSWPNNYDGAALTTPAPATVARNAASQDDLIATSFERIEVPGYPWNLLPAPGQVFPTSSSVSSKLSSFEPPRSQGIYQWNLPPVPSQVTPTSSSASSKISSFEPPRTQVDIPSRKSSVPTDFQKTLALSLSRVQQPPLTTLITSVVPVLSVLPSSSTTASTLSFSNISSASESAVTATPSCTGKAKFTINFDDLPHFSTTGDEVHIPPIFNPYRKLYFEDHYGYVPPPSDPFPPVSPPQLAVYRANQGLNVDGSPDAGLESVGEFGAGPRASDSAYWIDAFSLWLGCENAGPSDCIITINGYDSAHSTRAVSKTVIQPPCPGLLNCKLALVELTDDFRNLAGIQILAAVDRKLTAYYIDDVSLGWSNNTCAAQDKRSSTR